MFWDGSRWIDERVREAELAKARSSKHRPHRPHLVAAVAAVVVGIAVFSLPTPQPAQARYGSEALTAAWGPSYTMDMVQESARQVDARGTWRLRSNPKFLGRQILTSWHRGATISTTFTGTGIAIIGPTSRYRGRARISIDGHVVATVDSHSSSYHRKATLYVTTFASEQTHKITVTVLGTTRDTKFSVDAFAVRHAKAKARPVPTPAPSATPDPAASVDPTATPAPASTPAPTEAPLVISAVSAIDIASTSAKVTWTLSEPATGQVEYGTTTRYGETTTLESSFRWSTHVQPLAALTPGVQYHFRTHSVAADGQSVYSDDETFTTTGASADPTATPAPTAAPTSTPAPTTTPAPTATPRATPTPTPAPTATPRATPTPTPSPVGSSTMFGSAFNADTLANTQVGGSDSSGNTQVAFRFRATSSSLTSVRFFIQSGSGYGAGTGGTIELSIRPDAGGAPSSTVLGSASVVHPGTSVGRLVTFSPAVSLTPGAMYDIVFRNTDASPRSNFVSVNATYVYGAALNPLQPGGSDMSVLINQGSWSTRTNYMPIVDVGWADGSHSGQGYMEVWIRDYANIGGSAMARESFTNPTARTITTLAVRVRRTSGSGALTLSIPGVVSATVPASAVPASAPGGDNGGAVWVTATLSSPVTLPAGPGSLVLSAPSGTTYTTFPVRKGGSYGYDAATWFSQGQGQYTTGGSWQPFNGDANGSDLQFYVK
jgi:hypothetical protein